MSAPIIPMLDIGHVALIQSLIFAMRPRHVLEWGAGGSTIWFPDLCEGLESWIAVEHDPSWKVSDRVVLVPDRDAYVGWPLEHKPNGGWNLMIVDGRWRSRCLRAAREALAPGGVVLLHDAERPYYLDAAAAWPRRLRTTRDNDGRELWLLSN